MKVIGLRRVIGMSMLPTLSPGQIVIYISWWYRLRVGSIVIFKHDNLEKIKRVHAINEGQLYVLGDAAKLSTDSRHFGYIARQQVLGVLLPSTSVRKVVKLMLVKIDKIWYYLLTRRSR